MATVINLDPSGTITPIEGDPVEDPSVVTEQPATTVEVLPGQTIATPPLTELQDVTPVGLEDHSILMYNATEGLWKPTRTLENHFVIAGQY